MSKYTPEIIEYIKELSQKDITDTVIAEMVSDKFKIETSKYGIRTVRNRFEINKKPGEDGRFKKGHIPANKGKKMTEETRLKLSRTWFQKGHKTNCKPMGSLRRCKKDCIWYIKTETEKWEPYSRVIWKKHHGEIPEGHIIVHLDSNIDNFNIENLACVSKNENLQLNRKKLRFEDAELTKTGLNIVKLENLIKGKKK